MNAQLRKARPVDRDLLVELMSEFYAESGYRLNRERAQTAFGNLLADGHLGHIWIIQADSEDVGYIVLTLGYSMEYGGRDAFVDDLFVRPAYRGFGLAKLAMERVLVECERLGVRALHLEVGRDNAPAQALYRQTGFRVSDRQLLTLKLADPSHSI